jgi:hypothetical protein
MDASKPLERGQLLVDGIGDVVLSKQLADGPLLAFGARAIVSYDVEDEGIVS